MKSFHRSKISGFAVAMFLVAALAMPVVGESNDKVTAKSDDPNGLATGAAHAAASGDPLLESLLTELDRSTTTLKMDQVQRPYYLEYRVHDVEDFNTEAAFGALREDQHTHVRVLRVVVRLGDYKQDSFYNQGVGSASILTVDNDSVALRRQIWLLTDEAYKAAADAYAEKLSALKQFSADPNPVDDFARAPVISYVSDTVKLKVDEAAWKKAVQDMTELYRKYPDVQSLTASARFNATNEYLVNSEGSVVRDGRTTSSVMLNGSTQADDGMRLSRNPYWTEPLPQDLPSHEMLMKEATKMLDTLVALKKAPIVEESYRGPVLFAPDAADDVVAGMIGGNILGRKPAPGRPNRTTGGFATSYKTRVLPKFVTVVDDPTLKVFQGKKLLGSYNVDSEGVKAQAVTVINDGVLQNYLVNRQPIRDFNTSNGHGRASPGTNPQPAVGTLIVKSSEAESVEELQNKALGMAAEQSKPYAYRVDTMGPGNTPRLLYRIYTKDGREELVRGAVFNELDIRALRNDLVALGNDPLVSNRIGGIGQTVIAPSLLFDELEVKRADTSKEKLPEYPAPTLKK
jgi:predicted Zn-dependent protease